MTRLEKKKTKKKEKKKKRKEDGKGTLQESLSLVPDSVMIYVCDWEVGSRGFSYLPRVSRT